MTPPSPLAEKRSLTAVESKRTVYVAGSWLVGPSLGVWLGGFACRRLLTLNRFVHWLHDVFDRPYWSLAQHLKSRFPGAQRYVERYQRATLAAAREAGVDGVVCGHIHRAAFTEVDGLLYCNDGDWVESCTAVVEHFDGRFEIVHWLEARKALESAVIPLAEPIAA